MKHFFIIIITTITTFSFCFSQQTPWPARYIDDVRLFPFDVWETYDKGFVVTSWRNYANAPTVCHSGLLLKADINGGEIWRKYLLAPKTLNALYYSALTDDGGIIISGYIKDIDPEGDPFIIKLDACGEKEWCKIFHTPNHTDWAPGIVALPEGGYIFNWRAPSDDIYERNALVRLDEYGEIQWKIIIPEYTNATVKTIWEKFYEIKILQDGNLLLVGETYPVDPEDSTHLLRTKPIWLKVSPNGDELWKQTWDPYNQMFSGRIEDACQLPSGNIYSSGKVFGNPFLFKVSNNGDTLYRVNLNPNSDKARATTISLLVDNSLIIGMGYEISWDGNMVVMRTDTLGNIMEERTLFENVNLVPTHGITTHDNYALILAPEWNENNDGMILFKMDENLEDAPYNNGTYTYDSLCHEGPITNDTVWVNGDIVGIEESMETGSTELQIVPNPASSQVNIVMPKQIHEQLNTHGVSFSHTQYQYKGVLEVFNLQGQMMHSAQVHQADTHNLDISHWPKGLYGLRLIVKGRKVAVGKLIKE